MPRLTPDELNAARVRSGNLGGRPPKPTVEEARAEALERLVPKAIRVLEEHLDSGRPDAWRAAVKVLEHGWGRPPDNPVTAPIADADLDATMISSMSTAELVERVAARRRRALEAVPDETQEREVPPAAAQ